MDPILSLDDLREAVRTERRRRGMTQAQAAALLGYTQKWVSEFESGKVDPPTSMTVRLMALLGTPLRVSAQPDPIPLPEGETESEIDLEMRFP